MADQNIMAGDPPFGYLKSETTAELRIRLRGMEVDLGCLYDMYEQGDRSDDALYSAILETEDMIGELHRELSDRVERMTDGN